MWKLSRLTVSEKAITISLKLVKVDQYGPGNSCIGLHFIYLYLLFNSSKPLLMSFCLLSSFSFLSKGRCPVTYHVDIESYM